MLPHAGVNSRRWRDVCRLGELIGRLGELIGDAVIVVPAVVLLSAEQAERATAAAAGAHVLVT